MSTTAIKVVVVRPRQQPTAETIERDLETFQRIVGGYVQCVPLASLGVDLWCDEEGRMKNITHENRYVPDLRHFVFGTFFLTGGADAEGETLGLTEGQVERMRCYFDLANDVE